MPPYKIIDHTSDIGVEIEAESLEKLFVEAIHALFFVITDKKSEDIESYKSRITKKKIRIKFNKIDDALIELLNRVILITYSKGKLILNPHVKIRRNKVILRCVILHDAYPIMERELKAATYHDFFIENRNGIYRTRIIFDV